MYEVRIINSDHKKVKECLEEFNVCVIKISEFMFKEIKKNCTSYGEVKEKFHVLRKEFIYKGENLERIILIFNEIERLIENEMNDLQITNRPDNNL